MPEAAVVVTNGFSKRAARVVSNAGLYQLVEDMAKALEAQSAHLADIHVMCTAILAKLA